MGTVLALVMFLIYVDNMIEGVNSYTSLFSDDAKVLRRVEEEEDAIGCKILTNSASGIENGKLNLKLRNIVMEFGSGIKKPS